MDSIIVSKKYTSNVHPKFQFDYEITKDPKYKNEIWFQVKAGFITTLFSLAVGMLLYMWQNPKKDQSYNQLKADSQKTKNTLDSLVSLPIFRKK